MFALDHVSVTVFMLFLASFVSHKTEELPLVVDARYENVLMSVWPST